MFCSKATLLFRSTLAPPFVASCCYQINTTTSIRIPRQYRHDLSHLSAAAFPTGSGGGYLAKLASTQSVHAAEMLFCAVHDSLHLPWWVVIVTTTFTLRALATSPLAVHQAKMAARAELLLPTLREMQEAVKHRVVTQCRREGVALEEANRRMMKEARDGGSVCCLVCTCDGGVCGAAGPSLHPPTLLVLRVPPSQDVPSPLDPAPSVVDTVTGSEEHVWSVAGKPSKL